MYSGVVRSRLPIASGEAGVQVGYFKTGNFGRNNYQMEALSASVSYSYDVTPAYTFAMSGNYMYFFDETFPFSLRREPYNDQPYQFSFTTLHEAHLSDKMGLTGEVGVLGLNYTYPQLHFGASINFKSNNWLLQGGFSQTITMSKADAAFTQQSYTQASQDGSLDFAVHPEFQFQYFF